MNHWQLSLTIHGHVQGVNFRSYAREKARTLRLVGWVRNEEEGTVGILAQGSKEILVEFLEWCTVGPRWAKVEKVEEGGKEIEKLEFERFEIRF